MPLYDILSYDEFTRVAVWDVLETEEEFCNVLGASIIKSDLYKSLSEKRKREYLGIRACLHALQLDTEIKYEDSGKPYIESNHEISLTHSYGKVAVASSEMKVGVDIELNRPIKIKNIKEKFIRYDEEIFISKKNENDYLHIIWGIKEGLYKLDGGKLWNFLHHYKVEYFPLDEHQPINCWISDEVKSKRFSAYYKKVEDYFLIWVVDYD